MEGGFEKGMDGTPYGYDYFSLRSGLENCRIRFEKSKVGRVAFLGGSITECGSWRDLVCQVLQQRFPETKFEFINAGISSTGSTPGAFRLERDVLGKGQVDLLFEDAAVNDQYNGFSDAAQIRGMEGIVRHARLVNPNMDIVVLEFVDPPKMAEINQGRTPSVIANNERVAAYYNVPSINLAREVTERIRAGEFSWEKDFVELHPSQFGNELYARSISRLFSAAWNKPLSDNAKQNPYELPEKPLDANSYYKGRLGDIHEAQISSGWVFNRSWKPDGEIETRKGFVDVPMLTGDQPGDVLTLKFTGTAIGIFTASGPDAGIVEYSIDQGPFYEKDLFTEWSDRLHIPWAFVLADDLSPGAHEVTLRISDKKNPGSKGNACRIVNFLLN